MKLFSIFTFIMLITVNSYSQQTLYQSDSFTITSTQVRQGQFEAIAISPTKLTSNYKSDYKQPTKRKINFKFSINGADNERYPGENHQAILYPVNGKFVSSIHKFGYPDPQIQELNKNDNGAFLEKDTEFTIRVDMRHVLADFDTRGYYVTFDGQKILADEFKGVYVAGETKPLTWEFENLPQNPQFKLTDSNDDGIYEVTIPIKKYQAAETNEAEISSWTLQEDVTEYPQYKSSQPLCDALYNMSIEEMLRDIREDGAFKAGAKWPGVWTRDISYSILLSLAIINPEASKKSLVAKVKNERIIQDTGTGGSWPVSSDRMTWALAAWEIYAVTDDINWLKYAYNIIKNSAEDDLNTVYNPSTGLFYGESSFLDWREQTYPLWMDAKDIYKSQNLGTNAVHYETYQILAEMADILGEPTDLYLEIAASIKNGINTHLWMVEKGYYGQYLYGRNYLSLSPKSETLGEAFTLLFNIADEKQQTKIIENTPVLSFGAPCIYPQIPNIPNYHNNGIWPFVAAYWTWASAKANNVTVVEHGLASIYRAAALFLTNKENMAASTGDFMGTEINSDRQLWSVAGNIATVFRVFFGMSFSPEALTLTPFIPESYDGSRTLKNFSYRNAKLNITINGYGSKIKSITLDGKTIKSAIIKGDLKGEHTIIITMANNKIPSSKINLVNNQYSPETPSVSLSNSTLNWEKINGAKTYMIYRNGNRINESPPLNFDIPKNNAYAEYQVLSVDEKGWQSFLSEPIRIAAQDDIIIQAEQVGENVQSEYSGFMGDGYIQLDKKENEKVSFIIEIDKPGFYSIDFRYANGNGPINTNNKCAIRTLLIDEKRIGAIILPQRGNQLWTDWGYSNSIIINLSAGRHTFTLVFTKSDNNMNGEINFALLDCLRLTLISNK